MDDPAPQRRRGGWPLLLLMAFCGVVGVPAIGLGTGGSPFGVELHRRLEATASPSLSELASLPPGLPVLVEGDAAHLGDATTGRVAYERYETRGKGSPRLVEAHRPTFLLRSGDATVLVEGERYSLKQVTFLSPPLDVTPGQRVTALGWTTRERLEGRPVLTAELVFLGDVATARRACADGATLEQVAFAVGVGLLTGLGLIVVSLVVRAVVARGREREAWRRSLEAFRGGPPGAP